MSSGNRVPNVQILAPREVQGEDTIPLRAVLIPRDRNEETRLEMVKSATDLITNAYKLNCLDAAFPTILGSVIEGKGLYEYSIGEFFLLYGRFEGTYQLKTGPQTRSKMEALIGGDERYLKHYWEHGKERLYPLPYAVRNILGHAGNNPNRLDKAGIELRTSIELLRLWLMPPEENMSRAERRRQARGMA